MDKDALLLSTSPHDYVYKYFPEMLKFFTCEELYGSGASSFHVRTLCKYLHKIKELAEDVRKDFQITDLRKAYGGIYLITRGSTPEIDAIIEEMVKEMETFCDFCCEPRDNLRLAFYMEDIFTPYRVCPRCIDNHGPRSFMY